MHAGHVAFEERYTTGTYSSRRMEAKTYDDVAFRYLSADAHPEVTQQTTDNHQLLPMLGQVKQNMGRKPEAASADAGYWSEVNATAESVAGIDLHIATGRDKHGEINTAGEPPPDQATAKEAMRQKLSTEAGRSIYKMRKAIVEPVFGQIKEARGFRRFSLCGLDNVRREWKLVCLTSNLLKLFGSGWTPQAA